MRFLLVLFVWLLFNHPSFSQVEMKQPESFALTSLKDSINNYVNFIDRANSYISDAYNGLVKGLKAGSNDSFSLAVAKYKQTVMNEFLDCNEVMVAEYLIPLKKSHLVILSSINDYLAKHTSNFISAVLSKRNALAADANTDTKYSDQLIGDFFMGLSTIQTLHFDKYQQELYRLESLY